MAFATVNKKTVSDGLVLTLSQDEAEALRLVLGYVGGPESDTPRKHTEAVLRTLKNAAIGKPAGSYRTDGAIRFTAAGTNPFDAYLTNSNAFTLR